MQYANLSLCHGLDMFEWTHKSQKSPVLRPLSPTSQAVPSHPSLAVSAHPATSPASSPPTPSHINMWDLPTKLSPNRLPFPTTQNTHRPYLHQSNTTAQKFPFPPRSKVSPSLPPSLSFLHQDSCSLHSPSHLIN